MYKISFFVAQFTMVLISFGYGPDETAFIAAASEMINGGEFMNYAQAYQDWLRKVENKTYYDSRLRPQFGGKALDINVVIEVISISHIQEEKMHFTVEMYYREYWKDERIGFNRSAFNEKESIDLHPKLGSQIWTPDTSFLNAVSSKIARRDSPTHRNSIRLYFDGRVFSSRRLSVTFECDMDFAMYPFDRQACKMSLSSYGMTDNEVRYNWHSDMIGANPRPVKLPDFGTSNFTMKNKTLVYKPGNYSSLELCIELQRRSTFANLQLFFPSTAVVASSWISLWNEADTQFADMITVILSIIFLSYSFNTMMPKVSYVKAMDIYIGACFLFVFISLVKLAFLKHRLRKEGEKEKEEIVVEGADGVVVARKEDLEKVEKEEKKELKKIEKELVKQGKEIMKEEKKAGKTGGEGKGGGGKSSGGSELSPPGDSDLSLKTPPPGGISSTKNRNLRRMNTITNNGSEQQIAAGSTNATNNNVSLRISLDMESVPEEPNSEAAVAAEIPPDNTLDETLSGYEGSMTSETEPVGGIIMEQFIATTSNGALASATASPRIISTTAASTPRIVLDERKILAHSDILDPIVIAPEDKDIGTLSSIMSMRNAQMSKRFNDSIRAAQIARKRVAACVKAFHFGSQLLLPICFAGFGLFFFAIYPNVTQMRSCSDDDV